MPTPKIAKTGRHERHFLPRLARRDCSRRAETRSPTAFLWRDAIARQACRQTARQSWRRSPRSSIAGWRRSSARPRPSPRRAASRALAGNWRSKRERPRNCESGPRPVLIWGGRNIRTAEGINCVWPISPAQAPRNSPGFRTTPRWTIISASISSARNRSGRRQSQASVASALNVGNEPLSPPKLVSSPQIATNTGPGTPKRCSIFASGPAYALSIALPRAIPPGVTWLAANPAKLCPNAATP